MCWLGRNIKGKKAIEMLLIQTGGESWSIDGVLFDVSASSLSILGTCVCVLN